MQVVLCKNFEEVELEDFHIAQNWYVACLEVEAVHFRCVHSMLIHSLSQVEESKEVEVHHFFEEQEVFHKKNHHLHLDLVVDV